MAGPARPANSRDELLAINGDPVYLGVLVSTGTRVDNSTTAIPFNTPALGPVGSVASPANFTNTLGGKVLLLQPSAAGVIMSSNAPILGSNPVPMLVALQTVPVAVGVVPGVLLPDTQPRIITMLSSSGWLQWLPSTGSANLFVWELR